MLYLIITTIIWSFSFSLIGYYLSPEINSWTLAFLRSLVAFIFFLPWLRINTTYSYIVRMSSIGALQLGLMYIFYLSAYNYTTVQRILLFTITTPFYVVLISNILDRKFKLPIIAISLLSVFGAGLLRSTYFDQNDLIGFLLIQLANLCFAYGQIIYRRIKIANPNQQNIRNDFAYFFLGALIASSIGLIISPHNFTAPVTSMHWILIIWLGIAASGLGYCFWNHGSTLVNSGTLAVMNNLVIPLGLFVEIIFFSKNMNMESFVIGAIIIITSIIASIKYRSD